VFGSPASIASTISNKESIVATTSSSNFTSLYGASASPIVPATPYGNANVVGLLAASTDGSNTIGNISATGNIAGTYFLGNGSQLTGITAASTYGDSNVVTLMAAFGSNTISTTGNITSGYIFGNGSQLTGLPATYGNANVAAYLPTNTSNIGANTISATGNIVTNGFFIGNFAGNISGNLIVPGSNTQVLYNQNGNAGASANFTFDYATNALSVNGTASVNGDVTGDNFYTTGVITATGNITSAGNVAANYFVGNGAALTGLPATYGNANVSNFLANYGSNIVSTTGNITAGFFVGNGSALTGVTSSLPSTISVSGNITGANFFTNGNVRANGFISASGDVYGNTGIFTNVSSGGNINAGGDISGGNIALSGFITAGTTISATGNITAGSGSFFLGNGSQLTGITVAAANSAVFLRDASNAAAYVSLDDSSKIVVLPGGGSLYYGGDGVDPNSFGSVDILNPQTSIANSYVGMTWANAANLAANPLNTMAITGFGASFVYDAAGQHGGTQSFGVSGSGVTTNTTLSATGNITAPYFIGNGSALTGITTTYGDSNVTTLLAGFGSNTISTTGNITGGNLSVTNIAGTLTTATQTNITSLGTLNSLVVTANIDGGNLRTVGQVSAGGNITGSFFLGNGSQLTGIASSYGNANVAANLAAFANNPISTTGNITAGNLNTGGLVSATGTVFAGNVTTTGVNGNIAGVNYITANYFVGNGSLLTSVAASTSIVNGTSNVAIGASGGNANVSIGGTSNVAVFATTGLTVTGNITGGNLTGVSSSVATGIINYKDYVATITYGATITPDIALGSIQQVTLTGNVTMNAFGGTPQAGQSMVIKFIQDGTGGRILSSTMKWAGAAKTLSTAPNAVDIASVFYDGTTYWASLTLAYA